MDGHAGARVAHRAHQRVFQQLQPGLKMHLIQFDPSSITAQWFNFFEFWRDEVEE